MKKKNIYILTAGIIVLLIGGFIISAAFRPKIKNPHQAGRTAKISPDYSQTVIPPNIAPLNFMIKEEGRRFYVKIYSDKGDTLKIIASKP